MCSVKGVCWFFMVLEYDEISFHCYIINYINYNYEEIAQKSIFNFYSGSLGMRSHSEHFKIFAISLR